MPKRADLPSAEDFFGRHKHAIKNRSAVKTDKMSKQQDRQDVKKVTLYLNRKTDSMIRKTQAKLYAEYGIEITKSQLVDILIANTIEDVNLIRNLLEKK